MPVCLDGMVYVPHCIEGRPLCFFLVAKLSSSFSTSFRGNFHLLKHISVGLDYTSPFSFPKVPSLFCNIFCLGVWSTSRHLFLFLDIFNSVLGNLQRHMQHHTRVKRSPPTHPCLSILKTHIAHEWLFPVIFWDMGLSPTVHHKMRRKKTNKETNWSQTGQSGVKSSLMSRWLMVWAFWNIPAMFLWSGEELLELSFSLW